jgi:hypothetical protein
MSRRRLPRLQVCRRPRGRNDQWGLGGQQDEEVTPETKHIQGSVFRRQLGTTGAKTDLTLLYGRSQPGRCDRLQIERTTLESLS